MKYFDTAFIIKLYVREPGSKEVIALANGAGGLACSDLGFSEFHAALHRNFREDKLTRAQFERALSRFAEDSRIGQWHWIPITRDIHEGVAEAFRESSKAVFLRCADAIHLTTAKLHGFQDICSNDRHLTKAAPTFGLTVNNPLGIGGAGKPFE